MIMKNTTETQAVLVGLLGPSKLTVLIEKIALFKTGIFTLKSQAFSQPLEHLTPQV